MTRIVHICEGFVGGLCTHLCTILPALVDEGFDTTLVVSLRRSFVDAAMRIAGLRDRGVTVHVIPMSRGIHPLHDLRSFARLSQLLSRHRFDIVHTHGSKAGALGRVVAAANGHRIRLHSPHCFAFLRTGARPTRHLYLGAERLLGRLTTRMIAVAPSEADIAVENRIVARDKCSVVMNALPYNATPSGTQRANTSHGAIRFEGTGGPHIVTMVGRLVDYKGVFRFLHAARLSKTKGARFLIVGDGELSTPAWKFVREHGLDHKVSLLGYVSDMESVYARSDIVALCSDAEAWPYCLLEAMRAGCAIVATAVIGNRDAVTHNATGLVVRPDPADVAGAIDDLLSNETKRRQLARRAHAYFCQHHTVQKQMSQLSRIYRSLCNGEEP